MSSPHIAGDAKFKLLASTGLPRTDYVIAGSGPLFARGWIAELSDIDVVARDSAWLRATALGDAEEAPFPYLNSNEARIRRVVLGGGDIEVLNGWFPKIWSVDDLVDRAQFYEGFPFVPLDVVVRYKTELNRPRDREHLALITQMSK